jgi:hypothetical protein
MILRRCLISLVFLVILLLCLASHRQEAVVGGSATLNEWVALQHTPNNMSAETPIASDVTVDNSGLPMKSYCRVKREPP